MLLSGVIDRVDVDPTDERRGIVRDYKSGAKRETWPVAHGSMTVRSRSRST